MTCEIVGCDKTATVYATERTMKAMCSDCYGYLSTIGLVEFVGVIRSAGRRPQEQDEPRRDGFSVWQQIRRAVGV